MKRILFHALLCILISVSASAASRFSSVNVNFVKDGASKRPLLTLADFTGANVSQFNDRTVLLLKLSGPGLKKLREFSKKHVGDRLEIRADETLIAAPVIRVPIESPAIQVDGVDAQLAQDVASLVNGHSKK